MSVFNYPESLTTRTDQQNKICLETKKRRRERKNSLFNDDGSLNIRKVSRDIMSDLLVVPQTSRKTAEFGN